MLAAATCEDPNRGDVEPCPHHTPQPYERQSLSARATIMGFLDLFSGARDIATLTISFREDGNHGLAIERDAAAPVYLDGPVLVAALLLHYACKTLHALGSGTAAAELRQHMALSAVTLSADRFEPFTSFIDQPGQCVARLQVNRAGGLSLTTTFKVPLRDTNNYVIDSVLLMFTYAVHAQPTAEHRRRLAQAVQALEEYYQTIGSDGSFKALREAPATAFERYCAGVS